MYGSGDHLLLGVPSRSVHAGLTRMNRPSALAMQNRSGDSVKN